MRYLATLVIAAVIGSMAFAQQDYFIKADMVRGAEGAMGAVCVPNSVFYPGEKIIFRAVVYDAATGEELKFEEIQERGIQATVHIEGHEDLTMFYPPPAEGDAAADGEGEAEPEAEGPPPGAEYFRGPWPIALDMPQGMYGWTVSVTDAEGNTAEFEPIGAAIGAGSITVQAAQ